MRLVYLMVLLLVSQYTLAAEDEKLLFRLHGSNTIGAQLGPELVKRWLAKAGYTRITQTPVNENEYQISAVNKRGDVREVEIRAHGSSTGFKSLMKGQADIGMSSRPIKNREVKKMRGLGDMLSADSEYVVGMDGIAVIINRENPLSSLSKHTVKKIFAGEITHWQQITNKFKGKIKVHARDDRSGTYDTFKALVLGKKTALVKNALRFESNAELSQQVSLASGAIGFVGLPYINASKAVAIAEKGAHAKEAKSFDVATEDYALSRRLYMYVPDIKQNKHVESFIAFSISDSGQDIVASTGFVSQKLSAQTITPDPRFPEEYLKFTAQGQRLSLNLRFKKGGALLDNKANRDMNRLVAYMKSPANRKKRIMLFGFAEGHETTPVFSLDLSIYRADYVSDLLVRKGVGPVRVRGYGSAIPVASSEDAGGRHKNRRVEVWVR